MIWCAISAAAGSEDANAVTRLDGDFIFSSQIERGSILFNEPIFPECSRLTSFQSIGGVNTAFGKDGHVEGFQKFDFPHQAVSSPVFSLATRSLTNGTATSIPRQARAMEIGRRMSRMISARIDRQGGTRLETPGLGARYSTAP